MDETRNRNARTCRQATEKSIAEGVEKTRRKFTAGRKSNRTCDPAGTLRDAMYDLRRHRNDLIYKLLRDTGAVGLKKALNFFHNKVLADTGSSALLSYFTTVMTVYEK